MNFLPVANAIDKQAAFFDIVCDLATVDKAGCPMNLARMGLIFHGCTCTVGDGICTIAKPMYMELQPKPASCTNAIPGDEGACHGDSCASVKDNFVAACSDDLFTCPAAATSPPGEEGRLALQVLHLSLTPSRAFSPEA